MIRLLILVAAAIMSLPSCTQAKGNDSGSTKQETKTKNVMKTTQMTKQTFIDKVMDYEKNPQTWEFKGDKPVVIDFYATWCGPCKMMAPIMDQLAEEYDGKVDFYKVDTGTEEELASVFGIRSIPSFLLIPVKGSPIMTQGAMPKEQFKKMIDEKLLDEQK